MHHPAPRPTQARALALPLCVSACGPCIEVGRFGLAMRVGRSVCLCQCVCVPVYMGGLTYLRLVHSTATAIVSIGCCYQWVTEAGATAADGEGGGAGDDAGTLDDERGRALTAAAAAAAPGNPNHRRWGQLPSEVGYPLSEAGAALQLPLGRITRNLACQVQTDTERDGYAPGSPGVRVREGDRERERTSRRGR
jgi:hypothetical protein